VRAHDAHLRDGGRNWRCLPRVAALPHPLRSDPESSRNSPRVGERCGSLWTELGVTDPMVCQRKSRRSIFHFPFSVIFVAVHVGS
jgi:hypothetical protein